MAKTVTLSASSDPQIKINRLQKNKKDFKVIRTLRTCQIVVGETRYVYSDEILKNQDYALMKKAKDEFKKNSQKIKDTKMESAFISYNSFSDSSNLFFNSIVCA